MMPGTYRPMTTVRVFARWNYFATCFDPSRLDLALSTCRAKVDSTVDRCRDVLKGLDPSELYVGHSGGKDSVVAHFIATSSFPNIPLVHTPKSEQPNKTHPSTVKFLYELSAEHSVLMCPPHLHRFLPYETQIDGTRALEAERSDGRSTDLVVEGKTVNRKHMQLFNSEGLFGKRFVYPIFDWTDTEVWAAIFCYGLLFSDEYLEVPWVAES